MTNLWMKCHLDETLWHCRTLRSSVIQLAYSAVSLLAKREGGGSFPVGNQRNDGHCKDERKKQNEKKGGEKEEKPKRRSRRRDPNDVVHLFE